MRPLCSVPEAIDAAVAPSLGSVSSPSVQPARHVLHARRASEVAHGRWCGAVVVGVAADLGDARARHEVAALGGAAVVVAAAVDARAVARIAKAAAAVGVSATTGKGYRADVRGGVADLTGATVGAGEALNTATGGFVAETIRARIDQTRGSAASVDAVAAVRAGFGVGAGHDAGPDLGRWATRESHQAHNGECGKPGEAK